MQASLSLRGTVTLRPNHAFSSHRTVAAAMPGPAARPRAVEHVSFRAPQPLRALSGRVLRRREAARERRAASVNAALAECVCGSINLRGSTSVTFTQSSCESFE